MQQARSFPLSMLRLLALPALFLASLTAHADAYSDVNQLLRAGKPSEALTRADSHLAGKPHDPQMRFLRGVILSQSGRAAEAMAAYTALVQDHPELPEPHNNLAVLYAGQSQFDKAREALEMALRANPQYAIAHENLGDVYLQLARQSFTRAVQFDPANISARAKLAKSDAATPTPSAPTRSAP